MDFDFCIKYYEIHTLNQDDGTLDEKHSSESIGEFGGKKLRDENVTQKITK